MGKTNKLEELKQPDMELPEGAIYVQFCAKGKQYHFAYQSEGLESMDSAIDALRFIIHRKMDPDYFARVEQAIVTAGGKNDGES